MLSESKKSNSAKSSSKKNVSPVSTVYHTAPNNFSKNSKPKSKSKSKSRRKL